jgi:cobalamin biosynthesis protein CobW
MSMKSGAKLGSKIPATVITGFLGAGKTTLIQNLLRNANGRRLALIINEFGETGIDGELVKGCKIEGCPEENIVELANGCICCTVADDFLPTIQALLDRPNPPEHIVIETSGLALPKPLVKAFNWPEVRTRVTVDGVIAVVDGPAAAAGRFADDLEAVAAQRAADGALDHDSPIAELFEDQINCADLIVLNKNDQMDDAARALAIALIAKELKSAAKVVPASFGAIDPNVLLGLGAAAESDLDSRFSHHELEGEDHDHDDFFSFHLDLPQLKRPEDLIARLLPAIERHDILRVKGFMDVAGKDMRLVLQGVGPRLQHYYDRAWDADETRRSRLVVIGLKGLDRAAIARDLGL